MTSDLRRSHPPWPSPTRHGRYAGRHHGWPTNGCSFCMLRIGPESAYALPSGRANEPLISTEKGGLSNQNTLYKSQIMPSMSHMNPCEPLNPHIPIASPFLRQWHPKKALDSALRDIRAKFADPKSQNTPSPDIFDPKYSKILFWSKIFDPNSCSLRFCTRAVASRCAKCLLAAFPHPDSAGSRQDLGPR